MVRTVLLVTVLLYSVGPGKGQGRGCAPQSNCRDCLKSPGCAWCKATNFLKAWESSERRCDTRSSLTSRGCGGADVVSPEASLTYRKNNDLSSDKLNVVQLKPQNLYLKLLVGVPQTFTVSFKRAQGYPIDLYYLMDLSFSMRDDLDTIKNLGEDILKTLSHFTESIHIGFGSFVDKVALPYVSLVKAKRINPCPGRLYTCQPAFSFRNVLSLTHETSQFRKKVSEQSISGNLDSPESGFDAIMQAVVCQRVIGWRNNTRILVFTSDDTFHMAGDGKLAGIHEPHDGRCHLNGSGFYDGTQLDYPSVGHLANVLAENNIQLIFAVTEDSVPAYKALSELIPQSVVGVLRNDSSNVVQLISDAYENLSSAISLEAYQAPPFLRVSYQSHCVPGQQDVPWQTKGLCDRVKIDEQVDFTVRLNISECLEGTKVFYFKVQGITETLSVSVATLCDCDCDDSEASSEHCNHKGNLTCGVCSCEEGHRGQSCECEQQIGVTSVDASCRQDHSSQLCSGHGTCECGQCKCQGGHQGEFCQCDDTNCPRHNNLLCGGHGKCNCGQCECDENYKDDACQCSTLTDQCTTNGQKICNMQGTCECNTCRCGRDFSGADCATILNACQKYKECVSCALGNDRTKNCTATCGSVKPTRVDDSMDLPCSTDMATYKVFSSEGRVIVNYREIPKSIDKTYVIIGSSVSGIIVIGIIVILVTRLMLELHYRREYSNFLKYQKETDWKDTHNPLFEGATTTTVNPLHEG